MDTSYCLQVSGFKTAHLKAGIKKSSKARGDMGLIVADEPAICAAVFTKSLAAAAPVHISRANLQTSDTIKAVLVNSGNANACTGKQGEANCRQLGTECAQLLGIDEKAMVYASTGVIGHQLPMDIMQPVLKDLAEGLGTDNGFGLAETIMTTDLRPKWTFVQGYIGGQKITISGICKGSGMIAPNMATMLGFVLTDAVITAEALQALWSDITADTFNRVSVDTDTSTNDSGFVMASSLAGNPVIDDPDSEAGRHFRALLYMAVNPLAKKIADDGEGATKMVRVEARGFGDDDACAAIARTVADSPLVKTAMFGNDPNWGRIIAAAGRAGIDFKLTDVDIHLCRVPVFVKGAPAEFDAPALAAAMQSSREAYIDITGRAGGGASHMYTCDYSYDYIKINADYHT